MPYKFNIYYSLLFKITGFTDPFIFIYLIQMAAVYCLTLMEARGPKSRCWQG